MKALGLALALVLGACGPRTAPAPSGSRDFVRAPAWSGEEDAGPGPEGGESPAFRDVALALHVGDLARAEALAARLRDPAERAEAERRLAEARTRGDVDVKVVAVLLPLSGRFAPVGEEVKAGVELAAAGHDVTLVFADTAGDEARAAAAVDEVVQRRRPLALLGPVGELETSAAAARAVALEVPMMTLSPAEGLVAPSAGIVSGVSSGEARARAAARAAARQGHGALAVFHPRDGEGRAQADAFAEEARRLGVRVVARAGYDPTATDLEPDVKAFLGLDPRTNERLRKHLARDPRRGWKTFSPDVAFDLLYIPDGYERAALVVAFLRYFNVELRTGTDADFQDLRRRHGGRVPQLVKLMGGRGWHHPGLIHRGGHDVEGAFVLDVFSGFDNEELPSAEAAEMAAEHQRRTGRYPTALVAEAYEATRLLLSARRKALAAKGPPRTAMARALAKASLEDGLTGAVRIDSRGQLVRRMILLRVEAGEFVLEDLVE